MIEEKARVIRVEESGFAWVETQRQSTCGSCSVAKGCGTSVIAKMFSNRRAMVRVIDPVGVSLGDEVMVGIEESALLRGSLLIYLLPLVFMLLAALLAQTAGVPEGGVIALGGLGLLAGFGLLALQNRRMRQDPRYQPVVLRRLPPVIPVAPGVLAP
ncbi:positive regulator of sigma(E), RseC/MucC [Ectothiorhodosinus mongolicus]|uniref:Positive regulator of sigma(E), RseC/MucC n=1 Tax=Ectothiorhodosinus mongolicus TaxID=233100 RepID=A0A1R3VMU3_9GAMM|nr:SoxR reducing system RseC family protein [Ectothiorhodosinus mongolicus]ULX56383.1 Fis family transcriptional regulator [Ectothiorhodosinus mongolicus]SIT65901.1 positive regulator of sigma(E), RseC/MucC [Ectothiorhodosinus mongolicus]